MQNAIEVKNLSVSYGSIEILKNLSFDIPENSITVIIGPNGSGKTTLLKTILGLIPKTKGEIKVFGKDKIDKKQIGYVPQRFQFDKTFPVTVKEFLSLYLKKDHNKEKIINDRLSCISAENLKEKQLGELSGGQLQRILIAKAILNYPKILLLDEPAGGIDIIGEKDFYEVVSHLYKKHGTTCVIVSHEIDIVFKYATNVLCLNKELVCKGVPEKALNEETLNKLYKSKIKLYKHNREKHG